MTLPTRDEITTRLLDLDHDFKDMAWDQPAVLGLLCDVPGKGSAMGVLAQSLPDPVSIFMLKLGHLLASQPGNETVREMIHGVPDVRAVVCITEGWSYEPNSDEEAREIITSGKSTADVVGAKECRLFQAVDLAGNPYFIERTRDGDLIDHWDEVQKCGDEELGGHIIEGLRLFMLAVAKTLPGHLEAVERLSSTSFLFEDDINDGVALAKLMFEDDVSNW